MWLYGAKRHSLRDRGTTLNSAQQSIHCQTWWKDVLGSQCVECHSEWIRHQQPVVFLKVLSSALVRGLVWLYGVQKHSLYYEQLCIQESRVFIHCHCWKDVCFGLPVGWKSQNESDTSSLHLRNTPARLPSPRVADGVGVIKHVSACCYLPVYHCYPCGVVKVHSSDMQYAMCVYCHLLATRRKL